MSNALDEFIRLTREHQQNGIEPQIVWGVVKSVNWDEKVMTATSIIDGLDYYNVLLGIGSIYRKPKIDTKCLLGIIGNKSAATFLIECEEFDAIIFKSDNTEFAINTQGIVIKKDDENLGSVLNDLITEINKIVVLQGTSPNVAALSDIKQRLNSVLK